MNSSFARLATTNDSRTREREDSHVRLARLYCFVGQPPGVLKRNGNFSLAQPAAKNVVINFEYGKIRIKVRIKMRNNIPIMVY